ncbi:hypothetical protein UlMin_020439 [Ulmus minor]
MAANKFATMLHRNTHNLVVHLVYAVLEWVLILLLLLNSLFGYLIAKFASFFGLQKPCVLCSRVDHILEPGNHAKSSTDFLCESHAKEISQLGYCSNHKKLAESQRMCGDCLASRPNCNGRSAGIERGFGFISWSSINENLGNDENGFRCCCCNGSLSSKHDPESYLLFKPSWGSLEYTQKGDLVIEALDEDNNGGEMVMNNEEGDGLAELADEHRCHFNVCSFNSRDTMEEDCLSSSSMFICYEKEAMEDSRAGSLDIVRQDSNGSEFVNQVSDVSALQCHSKDDDLDEVIHSSSMDHTICKLDHRLIPVELIDFVTRADQGRENTKEENPREEGDHQNYEEAENLAMGLADVRDAKEPEQDLVNKASEQALATQEVHTLSINIEAITGKMNDLTEIAFVEERDVLSDQLEAHSLLPCLQEDHSSINEDGAETNTVPDTFMAQNDLDCTEKATEQGKGTSFENNQENEPKEEKFPDTPTSVDSLNHFQKKIKSLDGSVVSELEGSDPVATIEQLKTALKVERKALSALYVEFEEERSASAIAANQTMAMITRLQEEKAAMQMEALQYQRMMEEQSEYDQEALQLLNDLMVKREKEKQELEKELEVCRKKLLDYEKKEKIKMIRRIRDGSMRSRNSSASGSHGWDSDELSIDLNREMGDEDIVFCGSQKSNDNNGTPVDTVLNLEEIALDCVKNISVLDESLTEFEEERLSILDQLKALEEKLVKLGDDDHEFAEDLKLIANCSISNVEDFEENLEFSCSPDENHCPEEKTLGSMAKKLLPLLDEAENETEGFINQDTQEYNTIQIPKFESDSNKVAIEEEVDHVYERLQALEADREFLKHCMSSIKKGDKGMDLLQEILQHLRDLKSIEHQMKNTNDEALGDEVAVN